MEASTRTSTGRKSLARKKSPRPPMRRKSPYTAAKAGKSAAKQTSAAKKLVPIRKSVGKGATKEEKVKARARAKEWAKNELGKKKKASQDPPNCPPPASVDSLHIIIDDDIILEGETLAQPILVKKEKTVDRGTFKTLSTARNSLPQRMSKLNVESLTRKDEAGNVDKSNDDSDSDIFFDALDYLPTESKVAVEEASDDDDNEIRDLRSAARNRVPGSGQWMEPIQPEGMEPDGISFSTWPTKGYK